MKISVHQTGGVFGVERRVEIADDQVQVQEAASPPRAGSLDQATAERMERLAGAVLDVGPERVKPAGEVVDRLTTQITITDDEGHRRRLEVGAGDDAPDAVWDLVEAVTECAEAVSTQEGPP